jgi:hydroxymethylpyrimidine/phosphomethylpyrimidine kinase
VNARALTIAGSDPSGGAGVQQDLRTFASLGVWGMSAITSLTVQDTTAVYARHDVAPDVVRAQIEAVARDIGVDAAKTGMVPNAAVVEAVARALRDHGIARVVVDPVLVSSSGGALADDDVARAVRELLLPRASVATPNAAEAQRLTGIDVTGRASQREAARALVSLGARAAVVTGGHIPGGEVVDVFVDAGGTVREFAGARVETKDTHGTGCVFSAALAAGLALGDSPEDACARARATVERALRGARRLGSGPGPVDPAGPAG